MAEIGTQKSTSSANKDPYSPYAVLKMYFYFEAWEHQILGSKTWERIVTR